MEKQIKNELVSKRFIKEYILSAKKEILVSSSWFVDDNILEKLLRVSNEGVQVALVVETNYWQKKLQGIVLPSLFKVLSKLDLNKNVVESGYRYVIDKQVVIYTKEDKVKYESFSLYDNVVITEDKTVLEQSLSLFNKNHSIDGKEQSSTQSLGMFSRLRRVFKKVNNVELKEQESLSQVTERETNALVMNVNSVDTVLDSLVTTSIESFDKEEVKEIGIVSAMNVRGNPESLYRMMDTVYGTFVNNVNTHLRQKADLKTKIDLAVEGFTKKFSDDSQRKIETKKEESIAKEQEYKIEINNCENDLDKTIELIKDIEAKIPEKQIELKEVEQKKHDLNIESIPETETNSVVKGASLFIYALLTLSLLCAVFLFYASASYILIYARQDGVSGANVPSLVDLDFYYKAFVKQGWAVVYILVFCAIPIGLAWFANTAKKSFIKISSTGIVVLLDALVAFNVQKNINEIKVLKGEQVLSFGIEQVLELGMIFFLGFVPLTLLIMIVNRLRVTYKRGKYDKAIEAFKLKEDNINQDIIFLSHELSQFENERDGLKQHLINTEGLVKELQIQLEYIPAKEKQYIDSVKEELDNYILSIKNRAKIYKNGIDNNRIYLPVVALKDRISVFVDGWRTWLYEQYSEKIAASLLIEADEKINTWLEHNNINIPGENIIKMINLDNHEN